MPPSGRGALRTALLVFVGAGQLVGVGVVVEQLAVAAPVDRGVQLLLGILGPEPAAEQIEKESRAQTAVSADSKGLADRADKGRAGAGLTSEDLLTGLDVSRGEFCSDGGEFEVAAENMEQVEHGGGIDQRQQDVDLEVEFVGDPGHVGMSTSRVDDLHQAGK